MPIVNPGIRRVLGKVGGIPIANRVLHVDAANGITASADRVSQWSDISGQAHHLLQASGANQPIHLPAGVNDSGTAQAGSTGTTLNLATSAWTANDAYNGMTVTLTGGTGAGQSRTITDYAGATRIATVAAWSVTPDATTTYSISADRPSVLFDGAAHFMDCVDFTLNQPEIVYLVGKQITYTNNDTLFDGTNINTMRVYQNTTPPNITMYAGAFGATDTGFALGTTAVISAVFNGASSSLKRNLNAASTADAGSNNAGGFTLGRDGGGTTPSNIQIYEALIYNVAHDAATRANIIRALMAKHGVA